MHPYIPYLGRGRRSGSLGQPGGHKGATILQPRSWIEEKIRDGMEGRTLIWVKGHSGVPRMEAENYRGKEMMTIGIVMHKPALQHRQASGKPFPYIGSRGGLRNGTTEPPKGWYM